MRFGSLLPFSAVMMVAITVPAVAMPRAHRGPTSPKLFAGNTNKHAATVRPAAKPAATHQRIIEANRATQIQSALIKSGYMSGSATGVWDAQTETAMQKLQADNGWQTKIVPDARAIIKLGLGPGTTPPETETPAAESPIQTSDSEAKATIPQ